MSLDSVSAEVKITWNGSVLRHGEAIGSTPINHTSHVTRSMLSLHPIWLIVTRGDITYEVALTCLINARQHSSFKQVFDHIICHVSHQRRFSMAMSSENSETETEVSSSESEAEYSIESLSYDELVEKVKLAKLDYHIHHTNMHAVIKTIFEYRNVPAAARMTTSVKIRVEDDGIVYESTRVPLTELHIEEECCRNKMREAQALFRVLESRRQELLKSKREGQASTNSMYPY